MINSYQNIDFGNELDIYRTALNKLKSGTGSIICISGEQGFGKSHLIHSFFNECNAKYPSAIAVETACQAPIGKFRVGHIQPLMPFNSLMEQLLVNKDLAPEKRLAINVGMTVLSAIPIAGEIFYAVKEISKDYRQFRRDKSSEKVKKTSSAVGDYYDAFLSYSEKSPLVLIIDDIHWSDAQSIELLSILADNIENIRILLVISYRKSMIEANASPILTFVDQYPNKKNNIIEIQLEAFTANQISASCLFYLPNYKSNHEFEEWLMARSFGVPGVLSEYFKYFMQYPPFQENGELSRDFYKKDYLPSTVHAVFAQNLETLTDEERNILAVCSAEGNEFTALIVSNLLNVDVLSAIKKLRSLQLKTGIIHSLGVKTRYGVKTTAYRFTQGFYHTFFEKSLEYEEHIALHGQIAALLKQKYDETEIDEIKEQIAPFLAAHCIESGDNEVAKHALLVSARAAQRYGNSEAVIDAYQNFAELYEQSTEESINNNSDKLAFQEVVRNSYIEDNLSENQTDNNDNSSKNKFDFDSLNFEEVRKTAVNDMLKDRFDSAIDLIKLFLQNHESELDDSQKAQLYSLSAKAHYEIGQLDDASELCDEALIFAENHRDNSSKCFALNTKVLIEYQKSGIFAANKYLMIAARDAMKMPVELRLLTISNIANILQLTGNSESRKYTEAARKLCYELNFKDFADSI